MNSAIHNGGCFLLVDLLDCQLICQQIWRRQLGNLPAKMQGVFLPADLPTVSKYASRFGRDSQEFCLQKWGTGISASS